MELAERRMEYRLAGPGDAAALVAFHNSYYGTDRTPEHWLWEYETYVPSKSVFACAEDSGKIIATQGMIPIPVQVGTGSVLSGKSESTLLLPAYRGSSLMADLYEYAVHNCGERGMQFLWGFTGAVKAFWLWVVHFPVVQAMRPGNIWIDALSRLRLTGPVAQDWIGSQAGCEIHLCRAFWHAFLARRRTCATRSPRMGLAMRISCGACMVG